MASKVHVKKGDEVVVLTGRDRGKKGTVLEVLPAKQRVVVDGVNIVKKHQKPRPPAEEGGIKEVPASIHASNVKKVEKAEKAAKKTASSSKKKTQAKKKK